MNNEQQAFLDKHNHIQSQRDLFTLRAKMNASSNRSENLDTEPVLDIANNKNSEVGRLAAKRVLSTLLTAIHP